jgi:hypothetical protein
VNLTLGEWARQCPLSRRPTVVASVSQVQTSRLLARGQIHPTTTTTTMACPRTTSVATNLPASRNRESPRTQSAPDPAAPPAALRARDALGPRHRAVVGDEAHLHLQAVFLPRELTRHSKIQPIPVKFFTRLLSTC